MGLILFLLVTAPFFVLFTFLLVLKLSETLVFSWDLIFVPIWLLFIFWFFYIFYIIWKKNKVEYNMTNSPQSGWKNSISFHFISLVLLLVTVIMLCISLKKSEIEKPKTEFFIGLFLPFWIYWAYLGLYGLGCGIGSKKILKCKRSCTSLATWLGFCIWGSILTLSILLSIKLMGKSLKWSIVFIPLWFTFFFWFCSILYLLMIKTKTVSYDFTYEHHSCKIVDLLVQTVIFAAFLYFSILLNMELESDEKNNILATFFPVILLLFILFCFAYSLEYKSRPESHAYSLTGNINKDLSVFRDIEPQKEDEP